MNDPRVGSVPLSEDVAKKSWLRGVRESRALRLFLQDSGAKVGLAFILIVTALALFAPLLAPYDPTAQSMMSMLQPPGREHLLGTDEFGRDILSRLIFGARPALIVGFFSVVVSLLIGVPLGMIAGYFGGFLDNAITAMIDMLLTFPSLLLALLIVTLVGSSTAVVVFAIGIAHVPIFVRLARSSTLLVRQLDYVSASRSFGTRAVNILRLHILPNIIGPLVVMSTLTIAGAIREEAALSFLGLGIQPPTPTWGNMIRDGVNVILEAPWVAAIPGIGLTIAVLAFNVLGDTVRDIMDPRDLVSSASGGDRR